MGKKRELSSYIYITALLIFLLAMYVFNLSNLYDSFFSSNGDILFEGFRLLSFSMILLKIILCDRYKGREFAILFIAFAGIMSVYFSKSTFILDTLVFGLGAKGQDFKEILAIYCKVFLPLTFFIVLTAKFGLIESGESLRGTQIRNHLGFVHANILGVILFSIGLSLYYLWSNSSKKKTFLLLMFYFLSFLLIYFETLSRTTSLLFVLLSAFVIFDFIIRKIRISLIRDFVLFAFSGLALSSVLFAYIYDKSSFVQYLNTLVSNRIYFTYYVQENFSLSLFGIYIPYVSGAQSLATSAKALILDNAYCRLLFNYGIVVFSVVIYLTIHSINIASNRNQYGLLICFLFIFILGFMESSVLQVFSNIFAIVPFIYFYKENKGFRLKEKVVKQYGYTWKN